jgi:hypothetical protein
MKNVNMTASQMVGFEKRAGKGFGNFKREIAYWAWEIHWRFAENKGKNVVHGTDGGLFVAENDTPFERLRKRFINGVLLNKNERTGRYYSQLISKVNLFYINPESDKKTGIDLSLDILIATISFTYRQNDVRMEEPEISIILTDDTVQLFGAEKRNYLKKLLEDAHETILSRRLLTRDTWHERLNKVRAEAVLNPTVNLNKLWYSAIKPYQTLQTDVFLRLSQLQPVKLRQDTITIRTTEALYHYFEDSEDGIKHMGRILQKLRSESGILNLKIEYVL